MDHHEEMHLERYVFRHCRQFLTDVEQRAMLVGLIVEKQASAEAQGDGALARRLHRELTGLADTAVQVALADGMPEFRRRVTHRLLSDASVLAMTNRCRKCGRVVRALQTRQCLWCNHVWREPDA